MNGKKTGGWVLRGKITAVEMRGERNGECDYIRDVRLVSCRASAAAAAGAERSVKRTSLTWGPIVL